MPEPNVVVLHWNIQNYGLAKQAEAKLISKAAVETLLKKSVDKSTDHYVAFLLEIKVEKESTNQLISDLKKQLEESFKTRSFEVGFTECGGGFHNSERILYFYSVPGNASRVSVKTFSYKDEIAKHIKTDVDNAKVRLEKHNANPVVDSLRKISPIHDYTALTQKNKEANSLKPKSVEPPIQRVSNQNRYRISLKEDKWYRDGIIIEIVNIQTDQISCIEYPFRIAAIHMPGPKFMSDDSGILNAMMQAAIKEKISIFSGDFNVRSFKNDNYLDATKFEGGTTHKHDNSGSFSDTKYDRLLVNKSLSKNIQSDVSLHSAFEAPVKGGPKGKSLSDHGILISYNKLSNINRTIDNKPEPVGLNSHLPLE